MSSHPHAFSERLANLPHLGVGLSLSFGVEPDPVRLAERDGGPSFVEYAGAVQADWVAGPVERLHALGVPVLFHPSCLNLAGPWPNPPEWVAAVDSHVQQVDSAWLAQDVATCFVGEQPGYSIDLGYFVPPVLDEQGLEQAVQRVQEVQQGIDAPLLLEPAPVCFQVGTMDIFTWLSALARRTDSGLLLDAGHVISHQLALGRRDLMQGLDQLDLDRVVELHLAGGVIERGPDGPTYLDAHELPILPETWQVGDAIIARCPNLRAVCIECEGAVGHTVLPLLRKVRERIALTAMNQELRARVRAELAGELRQDRVHA